MSLTNFWANAADLDTDLNYRRIEDDATLRKAAVKGARGTYILPYLSALHSHAVKRVVEVSPQTSISNTAWAATTIRFKLDNNSIDTLESFSFELNVTNATAGAITFNSVFDMIDEIEIVMGAQTIARYRGAGLKVRILEQVLQEEFLRHQPNLQMSTAYGEGAALAINGTATYFLPGQFLLFDQAGKSFFPPGIRQDIFFNVKLAAANVALSAGSTATITGATLHLFGRELAPHDREAQMKLYASGRVSFRFLDQVQQTITLGSETSGTQYSQQLNAIQGLVAAVSVISRAPNPTGASVTTYRSLTQVEVTDAAGTNTNGGNALPDAFCRGPYSYEIGIPGQVQSVLNFYTIGWSQDLHSALKYGVFNGALPMKTTHRLRYIPAATNATGQLDVFADVYKLLTIEKGIALPVQG